MILYSIINVWADTLDLLPKCIKNHLKFSDKVIVVYSTNSNHFNSDNGAMTEFVESYPVWKPVVFEKCEPVKGLTPLANETRKRNHGIEYAKKRCSHYFLSDADEFYMPDEVNQAKKLFDEPNLNGIVCRLRVYVGKPTLSCSDHTLVPFIHKMKEGTYCGQFKEYPFAYDQQGNAHIDPSRRINETRGIIMSDVTMHHFSYVRANIDLKIQNSSANLRRSEDRIKSDIANAAPGYVSELYHKPLEEVENYFNIQI